VGRVIKGECKDVCESNPAGRKNKTEVLSKDKRKNSERTARS
jgi:hypothetical protein